MKVYALSISLSENICLTLQDFLKNKLKRYIHFDSYISILDVRIKIHFFSMSIKLYLITPFISPDIANIFTGVAILSDHYDVTNYVSQKYSPD